MEDRPSPRPASSGALKGLIVGGLIGGVIVAVMMALAPLLDGAALAETRLVQRLAAAPDAVGAWDLLALPLLILIVLATHEIGHLAGGMAQGMRFLLLIVGPFVWQASGSGTKFEWNTSPALMGGLAAALPTAQGDPLRRQWLWLIAGGPLASLLLAILGAALIPFSDPRFAAYLLFVAATSFGIFVVTLIPVRAGGFMSDGMQLIDVWRGGRGAMERGALMQIFAQSLNGVRPRDWDPSVMEELSRIGSGDPLRRTGGELYLLARAMDRRDDADIARYRALLEDSIGEYPPGFRQSVHIELALCAWLAGDADAVRRHIAASKGGIVEKSRRLLAQAALAKLEGRDADCERDRLLAIKALADASDAGQARLTEDQLAMLKGA